MNPSAAPFSFLAQAASAPFLFSQAEMGLEYIEDNDGAMRKGEYTAERLWHTRPEVYVEITRLLADKTISARQIKRQCKVHHLTITAIKVREGETIDTLRLGLGAKAMRLAAYTLETIEELLATGKFKPGELAFLFSALADKGQLLTGGATSRPEISKASDVAGTLNSLLDQMQEADARVVESTHSQPGEKIAVARDLDLATPTLAGIDTESTVYLCKSNDVTAFDAVSLQRGGEGVGPKTPPPQNKDA